MFEVTQELSGDRAILHVQGEVDIEVSPRLWSAMEEALGKGKALHVRLHDVTYIDSSGVATLIKGLRHAQKAKREFALVEPSDQVLAVIRLAQLDRLFSILETG